MFYHKFGLVKKLIVVLLGMQLIDLSVLLASVAMYLLWRAVLSSLWVGSVCVCESLVSYEAVNTLCCVMCVCVRVVPMWSCVTMKDSAPHTTLKCQAASTVFSYCIHSAVRRRTPLLHHFLDVFALLTSLPTPSTTLRHYFSLHC